MNEISLEEHVTEFRNYQKSNVETSNNTQSSLDRFFPSQKSPCESTDVAKELREIKSMLSAMNLSSNRKVTTKAENETEIIKEASNLLELSVFDELKIDMKDDGECFVQCLTCKHFRQASSTISSS